MLEAQSLLACVAEHLLDEERVAPGLALQCEQLVGRRAGPGDVGDERPERIGVEARELGAQQQPVAVQVFEECGERVVGGDVGVAVAGDEQEALRPARSQHVPQHPERRRVRGLEVVDEQRDRRVCASEGRDERLERVEEPGAAGARVGVRRRWRHDARELGEDEREVAGVGADRGEVGGDEVLAQLGPERLEERPVRRMDAVVAAATEHHDAIFREVDRELAEQARLADPGFAREDERKPLARDGPGPCRGEAGPRRLAADERRLTGTRP